MPPYRAPLSVKTETQVAKDDNAAKSSSRRDMIKDDNNDDDDSWRKEETTNTSKTTTLTKSYGISPQAFHHSKRTRDPKQPQSSTKAIVDMQTFHETVEEQVLHTQKREHARRLQMQRSAFKDLSKLKNFPVQDMAMELYQSLLQGGDSPVKTSTAGEGGDEPVSGESSASSGNSSVDAKRPMLSPESSPGKSLLKQQFALEFQTTDLCQTTPLWSLQPRMFATEKANGKRKYLVGHFGRVVDLYWRKTAPENRHLYEVLVEKTPCHMYFDLEFSRAFNPDIDEAPVLKELFLELAKEIQEQLEVKLERNMLIDLDSSNDKKFSRHWIVHLPGLFADAVAVGRFIKRWIGRLATEVATQQLQKTRPHLSKYLFVETKDPAKPTCIIDLGVYTRNRLFRCLGSRKFGKTAFLQISEENEYPIHLPSLQKGENAENETDGMVVPSTPSPRSNLQPGPNGEEQEDCDTPASSSPGTQNTMGEYVTSNDWRQHAQVLAETLVVPLTKDENVRIFEVPDESTTPTAMGTYRTFSNNVSTTTVTKVIHQSNRKDTQIRTATSPFPKLDLYVLEVLCTKGGVQGSIRACSIDEVDDTPRSITYQLNRNRYCEMIGRPHKSNNIYWTVDFKTWSCVQGCHDPECYGRSTPKSIPEDRLKEIRQEVKSWIDERAFDDALANLNIEDMLNGVVQPTEEVAEKANDDKLDEFDNLDDSFENALANLDLGDIVGKGETTTSSKNDATVEQTEQKKASSIGDEAEKNQITKKGEGFDDMANAISDDDLLEAALANPELFP